MVTLITPSYPFAHAVAHIPDFGERRLLDVLGLLPVERETDRMELHLFPCVDEVRNVRVGGLLVLATCEVRPGGLSELACAAERDVGVALCNQLLHRVQPLVLCDLSAVEVDKHIIAAQRVRVQRDGKGVAPAAAVLCCGGEGVGGSPRLLALRRDAHGDLRLRLFALREDIDVDGGGPLESLPDKQHLAVGVAVVNAVPQRGRLRVRAGVRQPDKLLCRAIGRFG